WRCEHDVAKKLFDKKVYCCPRKYPPSTSSFPIKADCYLCFYLSEVDKLIDPKSRYHQMECPDKLTEIFRPYLDNYLILSALPTVSKFGEEAMGIAPENNRGSALSRAIKYLYGIQEKNDER